MESSAPPSNHSRIYVIGDIHGCADLLDRMVGEIKKDLALARLPTALSWRWAITSTAARIHAP
jgi:hypothetical protein